MTNEQIKAMAELTGRHAAERFEVGSRHVNERNEIIARQDGEIRALATELGIDIPREPELPLPGMTDTTPDGIPNAIPPEVPPGAIVALPREGLPQQYPVARPTMQRPAMPRPLKARK
jgi:hypothetical protein